jgi:hypothetical protein
MWLTVELRFEKSKYLKLSYRMLYSNQILSGIYITSRKRDKMCVLHVNLTDKKTNRLLLFQRNAKFLLPFSFFEEHENVIKRKL